MTPSESKVVGSSRTNADVQVWERRGVPGARASPVAVYRRLYKELLTIGSSSDTLTIVMPAFESHVREYRIKAGFSQEALARELGVSRQTVVNVERGANEPKVLLALALAAILGAALGDLFQSGSGRVSRRESGSPPWPILSSQHPVAD